MKVAPFLLFALCTLASCSESVSTTDPWVNFCEDMAWLDSLKESMMNQNPGEIWLNHYKGERVFEVNTCVGCADSLTTVYDCGGNVLCEFGGIAGLYTCTDYPLASDKKLLLWHN